MREKRQFLECFREITVAVVDMPDVPALLQQLQREKRKLEAVRSEVRQSLAEHAEYGHWELARVRVFWGGVRKVVLRRKIIRVRRTA